MGCLQCLSCTLFNPTPISFHHHHSSDPALSRDTEDLSDPKSRHSVLISLDPTAAFDIIDCRLILRPLFIWFPRCHTSLTFFPSHWSWLPTCFVGSLLQPLNLGVALVKVIPWATCLLTFTPLVTLKRVSAPTHLQTSLCPKPQLPLSDCPTSISS